MKEARAHGSAVQQGGLAACAHEKQPQLQDEQLGGSSAEDAARADKRQGPPSSAAGAPRSLPDGSSDRFSIGWLRGTPRIMLILYLSTAACVAHAAAPAAVVAAAPQTAGSRPAVKPCHDGQAQALVSSPLVCPRNLTTRLRSVRNLREWYHCRANVREEAPVGSERATAALTGTLCLQERYFGPLARPASGRCKAQLTPAPSAPLEKGPFSSSTSAARAQDRCLDGREPPRSSTPTRPLLNCMRRARSIGGYPETAIQVCDLIQREYSVCLLVTSLTSLAACSWTCGLRTSSSYNILPSLVPNDLGRTQPDIHEGTTFILPSASYNDLCKKRSSDFERSASDVFGACLDGQPCGRKKCGEAYLFAHTGACYFQASCTCVIGVGRTDEHPRQPGSLEPHTDRQPLVLSGLPRSPRFRAASGVYVNGINARIACKNDCRRRALHTVRYGPVDACLGQVGIDPTSAMADGASVEHRVFTDELIASTISTSAMADGTGVEHLVFADEFTAGTISASAMADGTSVEHLVFAD